MFLSEPEAILCMKKEQIRCFCECFWVEVEVWQWNTCLLLYWYKYILLLYIIMFLCHCFSKNYLKLLWFSDWCLVFHDFIP